MALLNTLKKLICGNQKVPEPPKAPKVYDFSSAPVDDLYDFEGTPERYFTWIFSYYFSQLEIEKTTLPASTGSYRHDTEPIVFKLSRDSKPVLIVILCHGQEYRRACIRQTVAHYQSQGIPVQRYYTDFRNECTYVVERMKSAL